jgi:hypothetical protein
LIIDSDVVNSGSIWANGGNVTVQGNVSGSGSATISGNATLELGAASAENTIFSTGATGTLHLDQSESFTGTVFGFANGDSLDFADIGFTGDTSLTYSANNDGSGGTLSVTDGLHTANINFAGQYVAAAFELASDNGTGTSVTYTAPQLMPAITDAAQLTSIIVSTPANETLTGTGAIDTFVFKPNFGRDIITNFKPGNDVIQIDHTIFGDIQHLLDATHDVGGHAVIAADANNTITLDNVLKNQLLQHPGDFHFV